jgi:ABC-type lipoprotein release transport system permease subunit
MRAMEINALAMETGEIQIHAPGYRHDPDIYTVIDDPAAVMTAAEKMGFAATARLLGNGLAAARENSTGVSIRGIEPRQEDQVTLLHNHVQAGSWLSPANRGEVVLGRRLASILDVRPGSEVVLVAQAADGSMANNLFTVRGVLKSVGQGVDRGGLFISAADFREFFVLDSGAHEIVLQRRDRQVPLAQATRMVADMFPGLEVKDWRQLQPTLARLLDLSDVSLVIMLLITYAAVGMLVLNAMLMGVFERFPVFGVMKAVGFSGGGLFAVVFWETLIQVTLATVLALSVGLPLGFYFERHPIDFSFLLQDSSLIAGVAFEPQWYTLVTGSSVLMPVLFLYAVSLAAILYPASKAALISPVDAIHHQ